MDAQEFGNGQALKEEVHWKLKDEVAKIESLLLRSVSRRSGEKGVLRD